MNIFKLLGIKKQIPISIQMNYLNFTYFANSAEKEIPIIFSYVTIPQMQRTPETIVDYYQQYDNPSGWTETPTPSSKRRVSSLPPKNPSESNTTSVCPLTITINGEITPVETNIPEPLQPEDPNNQKTAEAIQSNKPKELSPQQKIITPEKKPKNVKKTKPQQQASMKELPLKEQQILEEMKANTPINQIIEDSGIGRRKLYYYRKEFEEQGLLPTKAEIKHQVLEAIKTTSITQVAKDFGISRLTIYSWEKQSQKQT